MDEDEDSALRAGRKQPAEHKYRFRFASARGEEPEASLPNPTDREVKAQDLADGKSAVVIIQEDGKEKRFIFPADEWLEALNVSDDKLRKLAQKFGVNDFKLFRLIIALAGQQGQKSKDYRVFPPDGPSVGADEQEFKLLREIDQSSEKLENALRELLSPKPWGDVGPVLDRRPDTERLLEALSRYGRFFSELKVMHLSRPAVHPTSADASGATPTVGSLILARDGVQPAPTAASRRVSSVCL